MSENLFPNKAISVNPIKQGFADRYLAFVIANNRALHDHFPNNGVVFKINLQSIS